MNQMVKQILTPILTFRVALVLEMHFLVLCVVAILNIVVYGYSRGPV